MRSHVVNTISQASKYSAIAGAESDDDLEEESLLETPLDSVEPYGLLKSTLISKSPRSHSPLAKIFKH